MPAITLFQFPPVAGLPSVSPFCVKVQMALRRCGLPFDRVDTLFARRYNPQRKLPVMDWDRERLGDSTAILRRIVRQLLHVGERLLPKKREISNPYRWAKDGKQVFDPEERPDLMRK